MQTEIDNAPKDDEEETFEVREAILKQK